MRCGLVAVTALGLALGTATVLNAQSRSSEAVPVSLEELLDTVRTVNPALKAARLDWVARLRKADEPTLPDPSVMFTYLPAPVFTARGSQRWQIRAEQRFPFPGKIRLQKEIAIEDAYITQQRAAELDLELSFELKRAYHALTRIVRQEQLARSFKDRLSEFENAAASRYRIGEGSQQAIIKAQLERNTLDGRLLSLDRSRRKTEAMISRLRGDGEVIRLSPRESAHRPLPDWLDIDLLVQMALHQRPDIRALDASVRRSQHTEDLARKELYPDIGLSVSYIGIDQEPTPATADGQDALAVSASVRVPLFRSGKKAAIDGAQITQTSAALRKKDAEIELRSAISDILWRLDREHERETLIRETLIPQAQTTFDLALSGYTNGKLQFIDLLDAERSLFAARNELELAREHYAVSIAELESVLGVRSLEELEQNMPTSYQNTQEP
jgi:outer membrane protein TolC